MPSLTSLDDLAAAGLLPAAAAADPALAAVAARYAVAVTPHLAAAMEDAPDGPLARQFLPEAREGEPDPLARPDPIGDRDHSPVEGIVHRYPDRVLLKAVHVCPVYCRFCFRREAVGPAGDGTLAPEALERALGYVREHPEVWEVILTGGDPLALSARRLDAILSGLAAIPHVGAIRLHTRVPLVDPDRIGAPLVAALRGPLARGKAVWVALHANHPDEFLPEGRAALARLADAGIALVSQTVLLRGINDDPGTLAALMRRFVESRVKPYYLHHPDLAPGTAHWRVPIEEGQRIVAALRGRVSGLCQPRYVLDLPGGHGKADLGLPEWRTAGDGHAVRGWRGDWHAYPPAEA